MTLHGLREKGSKGRANIGAHQEREEVIADGGGFHFYFFLGCLSINMGLINEATVTLSTGVEKAGTYISFANETLYLTQGYGQDASLPTTYQLRANYRIFWNKAAREEGKPFIDLQSVSVQLTASELAGNPYEALYAYLKTVYPSYVDEIRAAPAAPADPAAPAAPADPAAPAAPVADPTAAPTEPAVPSI